MVPARSSSLLRVPGGSSLSLVLVCAKIPSFASSNKKVQVFAIEVSTDTNAQLPKSRQKFGFPSEFIFANKYTFQDVLHKKMHGVKFSYRIFKQIKLKFFK